MSLMIRRSRWVFGIASLAMVFAAGVWGGNWDNEQLSRRKCTTLPRHVAERCGEGSPRMNADWPATLRTMGFIFAGPMSADHLMPFYNSPEFALLIGEDIQADLSTEPFENLADALAEEYTRLFVGPNNQFPPTEGLARGDSQLMGDHAIAVQQHYTEAGFEVKSKRGLLPDHIGVQLDFLANLFEREQCESARQFVRTHLLIWVPNWVSAFTHKARFQFYPAAGNALFACLREIAK